MNKPATVFLTCIALFFGIRSQVAAQGFGHFSVGPVIGNFSKLERDLQQFSMFGQDFYLPASGISVGGGGFAVMDNGIMIGGNGLGAFFGSDGNANGQASLTTGGGFFNLGYPMHRDGGWLLYPYAGFGYTGTTLELSNTGRRPVSLSVSHSLHAGETEKYTTGGISLEGGVGLKKLMMRQNSKGGFLFGIDLGTYGLPVLQGWEHDGEKITSLTSTRAQAFYIKLSFGGGFF